MSKRRNRELREQEAKYRLSRNPDFIAGALASGVPDAVERVRDLRQRTADITESDIPS